MPDEKLPPFEFEISLIDGQKVSVKIGADDFPSLRDNNPGYLIPADIDPRLGAATLLHSMLLHRVDSRQGETGVIDTEGKNWVIPATSIVAYTYRDPSSKDRRPLMGFTPAPR